MGKTHMKILCLSAHVDDSEGGCGGSIAKFIEEGKDVYLAVFSLAEESLPKGLPSDTLLYEEKAAAKVLGVKSQNLFVYRYSVRKFPQFRQEILEDLVKLNKEINPDLVLLPSRYDLHQDHHTIATEGLRAFKFTSILGYEMPWNNIEFRATAFVILDRDCIEKKVEALHCYKSQELRLKLSGRNESDLEYVRALARVRGQQIKTDYAEAFNVMRWIVK